VVSTSYQQPSNKSKMDWTWNLPTFFYHDCDLSEIVWPIVDYFVRAISQLGVQVLFRSLKNLKGLIQSRVCKIANRHVSRLILHASFIQFRFFNKFSQISENHLFTTCTHGGFFRPRTSACQLSIIINHTHKQRPIEVGKEKLEQ
ncbi:MAG: hypothetical protein ACI8RD_001177, partial [Bacillariaceae sp.]|jgi:hypothetical protein